MFGHADNVLSENSFQGWMGYTLSTPRVGYFFNCCFILLRRTHGTRQTVQGERQRRASIKNVLDLKPVLALSFSVRAVAATGMSLS